MRILILLVALLAGCGGTFSDCEVVTDTNRNHVLAGRAITVMGHAMTWGTRVDMGLDNQSVVTTLHLCKGKGWDLVASP